MIFILFGIIKVICTYFTYLLISYNSFTFVKVIVIIALYLLLQLRTIFYFPHKSGIINIVSF